MDTEKNNVNKAKIYKGIQKVCFGILLMFIGPTILYSAFKNQNHILYYPIIFLAITICLAAMYLFFRGIKTLVQGIFND